MALSPGAKVKRWRGATRHPGSSPSWGLHTRDGEAPTVLPNEETGHFPALAASGAGTTPPAPAGTLSPGAMLCRAVIVPISHRKKLKPKAARLPPRRLGLQLWGLNRFLHSPPSWVSLKRCAEGLA